MGGRTLRFGARPRLRVWVVFALAATLSTAVGCSSDDTADPSSAVTTTATSTGSSPATASTSTPIGTTTTPSSPAPSGSVGTGATASPSADPTTPAPISTVVITRVSEPSVTSTSGPTVPTVPTVLTAPTAPTGTVTGGADPMPTDPGQDPAAAPAAPLANAKRQSEAYSGIGQIAGFGTTCTGFLLDVGPSSGPAYAMTNGHCVGLFDSTTLLRDQPATDATMTFRLFADTPRASLVVPIRSVRYATMRGTDVAILQLGSTRAALRSLAAYRLGPAAHAGSDIRVVGIPVNGLPTTGQALRAADCTAAGTHRLLEWLWVWDAGQANTCRGIVGGSSGSPVFTAGSPLVVRGIINTTTIGADDEPGCYLGQPCQIEATGVVRKRNTSYALPVAAWGKCFSAAGFVPTAGCPVERTSVTVTNSVRAAEPGGTWLATVAGTADPLTKSGPAATTDCRRATGYTADAEALTAPLPADDGFYLLCAATPGIDGRPNTAGAGYAVVEIDHTPPTAPIQLSTLVGPDDVRVEPIFSPPEYSNFLLKAGPQAATDCADPDGYAIYRRIPLTIAISDLPATLCVIGEDEAQNRGVPHTFELV